MHTRTMLGFMAVFAIPVGPALATPPVGVTSQAFRNPLKVNVYSSQWGPAPLFNLLLQTSQDTWGYDLVHTINTFPAANANGTPSQSGWHDHPVPIGFVQIIQGALWMQETPNLTCLTYYPTGSILVEAKGNIHNAYNFDKKTDAILYVTWFMDRKEPATRTDQPDQITGNPNVASPPPPLCPDSPVPLSEGAAANAASTQKKSSEVGKSER